MTASTPPPDGVTPPAAAADPADRTPAEDLDTPGIVSPMEIAEVFEPAPGRVETWASQLAFTLGPIILAFLASALLLAILGRDPIAFYRDILTGGVLRASGIQDSLTRTVPILLIGAGLIVAFRASLWNLGADGQYLLAVAFVAGVGPQIVTALPPVIGWVILALGAVAIGAAWTFIPAFLKARYGLNEIVTTLMMSFIGVGIANVLVKGPFKGDQMVPQTSVIPEDAMLWDLPGTTVHVGVIVALVVVLIVHVALTRTSFGTRLDVLGANPRAAVHLGIDVPRLIIVAFAVSGALIGLAAAMDILGVFGYMRADWNPAYGLKVVPLVFLARLNVLAFIPLALFFGILSIGGDYATRRADLPSDFIMVFVGLMLLFMIATQYITARRSRGEPVLPRRRRRADAGAAA
jgi:simple sugar transport system permease protein